MYTNPNLELSDVATRLLCASIPHSGEKIPVEAPWLDQLPEELLMFDVDRFVDRLYVPILAKLKIPTVICPWHRYAVDLNRLPDDVDLDSVQDHPNPSGRFPRGLHWSITTEGARLMPQAMPQEAHEQIVQKYFVPFHADVRRLHASLLQRSSSKKIYHIDLHSMPSVGTKEHRDPGQHRADIVVSDCQGRSATKVFLELVVDAYKEAGFQVVVNWPYFGGRITETYGHPETGIEAIQIEMKRSLYMNETSKQLRAELLPNLQIRLEKALSKIHLGSPKI